MPITTHDGASNLSIGDIDRARNRYDRQRDARDAAEARCEEDSKRFVDHLKELARKDPAALKEILENNTHDHFDIVFGQLFPEPVTWGEQWFAPFYANRPIDRYIEKLGEARTQQCEARGR